MVMTNFLHHDITLYPRHSLQLGVATPNSHKGATRLGRRRVCYDDNGTHVVAKLHKLRKDQLFSLYERLRNMELLKDLPPISEAF